MYNWLKRKGYDQKYERAGIYCIKVDDRIVYIGKSHNMLKRVASHYAAIKGETERKYRILSEVQRKGHVIGFDVLYYAQETRYAAIKEEIGQKEGAKLTTKKSVASKELILKHSKDFNGTLADADVMTLTGLARNTYYKYKRELKEEQGL